MNFLDDKVFSEMFATEDKCVKTLQSLGALRVSVKCPSCGERMKMISSCGRLVFRCHKLICGKKTMSFRTGSFFFGSNFACSEVMRLAKYWLQGTKRDALVSECGMNAGTVTMWYRRFCELVEGDVGRECEKIGGRGVIVEVDETKFGRRKYHKGHRVEGAWVMTGIERTAERRTFRVQVDSRDSETLERVIGENVHEG